MRRRLLLLHHSLHDHVKASTELRKLSSQEMIRGGRTMAILGRYYELVHHATLKWRYGRYGNLTDEAGQPLNRHLSANRDLQLRGALQLLPAPRPPVARLELSAGTCKDRRLWRRCGRMCALLIHGIHMSIQRSLSCSCVVWPLSGSSHPPPKVDFQRTFISAEIHRLVLLTHAA